MNHWRLHAKQWQHIGEPLRPAATDIQKIVSWMPEMIQADSAGFQVLLLGVTPELATINWPQSTRLYVIDASLDMIQYIFPYKNITISTCIAVGNWLRLPLPQSSMDLVIGDGCFSMLPACDYDNLAIEIRRVLKPAGHCCMRFFVRPEVNESITKIYEDFISNHIDNFHVLKWRIAMALQEQLQTGVCLQDIWETWNQYFKQPDACFSWSEAINNTINVYKNNPTIYTFPSLAELCACLNKQFKQLDMHKPTYTLGERCPVFKLQSLDH